MSLNVDSEVFLRQQQAIEALLVSDPSTEETIRNVVRDLIKEARNNVSSAASSAMRNDPREAFRAVRNSVWKSALGGQINILNPRRSGSPRGYQKQRKLDQNPHQRGGNRRPRSARTEQVDGYYGKDRGFILRFVNDVTGDRQTRYGNRGSITGRGWFAGAAQRELEQAAAQLAKIIDSELVKQYNKALNG